MHNIHVDKCQKKLLHNVSM